LRSSYAETLRYNLGGVGGDPACPLQIPLDAVAFADIPDVDQFSQDMPYNTVQLQLSGFASVSQAIEVVRKARGVKWPLAVVSNNTSAQGLESTDTFLADFAVGVGAGQFMMGGVFSAECAAKYNRMMEITEESPAIRFVAGKFRGK
jgi:enolase